MKKNILIYIAGPYRSISHPSLGFFSVSDNIKRAEQTAINAVNALSKYGVYPLTPHLNTAHFERYTQVPEDMYWLDGTMAMMEQCDAVLLADHPALDMSQGTADEVKRAQELGMPVCRTVAELEDCIASKVAQDGSFEYHIPRVFY